MKSKVDPQRAREERAQAAFGAYAKALHLNKEWTQLAAVNKEAWCVAVDDVASALFAELDQEVDDVASALFAELDQEEAFILMLKLAMRDALGEDHISQLQTMFVGPGGLPGRVRLIVAPDRISLPFAAPLQGRHDG